MKLQNAVQMQVKRCAEGKKNRGGEGKVQVQLGEGAV